MEQEGKKPRNSWVKDGTLNAIFAAYGGAGTIHYANEGNAWRAILCFIILVINLGLVFELSEKKNHERNN